LKIEEYVFLSPSSSSGCIYEKNYWGMSVSTVVKWIQESNKALLLTTTH